jgi:error-prone DNA polymerase
MLGVRGHVQREGEVIHLIVEYLRDMSADLKQVSGLDATFPLTPGRGDEAKHCGHGPDSRERKTLQVTPRDMYEPDLHIDTLKVKARNFR